MTGPKFLLDFPPTEAGREWASFLDPETRVVVGVLYRDGWFCAGGGYRFPDGGRDRHFGLTENLASVEEAINGSGLSLPPEFSSGLSSGSLSATRSS